MRTLDHKQVNTEHVGGGMCPGENSAGKGADCARWVGPAGGAAMRPPGPGWTFSPHLS